MMSFRRPMIRTQIQLHTKQLKWLKRRAVEEGISMAQLIRNSIDLYQSQLEKSRDLALKKKRALSAVGAFTSSINKIHSFNE